MQSVPVVSDDGEVAGIAASATVGAATFVCLRPELVLRSLLHLKLVCQHRCWLGLRLWLG